MGAEPVGIVGLESFLQELRNDGIPVGMREVEWLQAVFDAQPALTDEQLRAVLRSILIRQERHRASFDQRFDQWIAKNDNLFTDHALINSPTTTPSNDPSGSAAPPQRDPPDSSRPPLRTHRRRLALWLIASALALSSALSVGAYLWIRPTPKPLPPTPPAESKPMGESPPSSLPSHLLDYPADPIAEYETWVPDSVTVGTASTTNPASIFLWLLAAAATLAAWTLHRRRTEAPKVVPSDIQPAPGMPWQLYDPLLRSGSPLLDSKEARAVVWGVERFESEDVTCELDLDRTVALTAAAAGAWTPCYRRAVYEREVWIWEDELHTSPNKERLATEIRTRLERSGLSVRQGTFGGSPAEVVWESGERFDVLAADSAAQSAIVLILTDGVGLEHAEISGATNARTLAMLSLFQQWPRLSFVNMARPTRGLERFTRRHRLPCIEPEGIAAFIGASSSRRDAHRTRARLEGALREWAAALAIGPVTFDEQDAIEVRASLDLGAPALAVSSLVSFAERSGQRYRWSKVLRLELQQWLIDCEREHAPDSLLARAADYWVRRLEIDGRRRIHGETLLEPYRDTQADRDRRMEVGLLHLYTHPALAAEQLWHLASEGHGSAIRRRLELMRPATPAAERRLGKGLLYLPWTLNTVPLEVQLDLLQMGFGEGDLSLQKDPRARARRHMSVGVAMGVAAASATIAFLMPSAPVSDPKFITDPPAPQVTQSILAIEPAPPARSSGAGYIAIFGPPSSWQREVLQRGSTAISVKWKRGNRPSTEIIDPRNGSVIFSCGTSSRDDRPREAGSPARVVGAISAQVTDPMARRIAMALLDSGTCDRVLVGPTFGERELQDLFQVEFQGERTQPALSIQFLGIEMERSTQESADKLERILRSPQISGLFEDFDVLLCRESYEPLFEMLLSVSAPTPLGELWSPGPNQAVSALSGSRKIVIRGLPGSSQLPEMVAIPGGNFLMGIPEDEKDRSNDEGPQHEVSIRPFFQARTEVTRGQWRRLGLPEPSAWKSKNSGGSDDLLPANYVSWDEARKFCNLLSKRENLQPYYEEMPDGTAGEIRGGVGYRLPTEAEWEYACRAGKQTRYWSGDSEDDLARVGWYDKNSGDRVHEVGTRTDDSKHPFGLRDMHGNVLEWCEDRWHGSYQGAPTNGTAWLDGASGARVIRGGSFRLTAGYARSAYRISWTASDRVDFVGFRPARSGS
ncbi:MAG: formylglycine-generating enzyme family protein [Planctomycetes bacterium]|nr:formylglycine-generating enzyme family protein [Planctomycetota bacterium]